MTPGQPVDALSHSPLEAALAYAARGWRVLPLHTPREDGRCSCLAHDCPSVGKHPRTRNGVKDATTDPDVIRRWWSMWPDANVGIACGGGLAVVDVDPRHDGDATLAAWEDEHGELRTLAARTGGGGWHFYIAAEMRNATDVAPGIDIRGEGGYVAAPPSLHASGRRYEWASDTPEAPQPPPAWLMELLTRARPNGNGKGVRAAAAPDRIPERSRNTTLASIAGTLRRRGLGEPEILAALREVNARRCDPPLDEGEVRRIAASIAKYPAGRPAGRPEPTTAPGKVAWGVIEARGDAETLTDTGNAARLVRLHGHRLHYVAAWDRWLVWDGTRWVRDDGAVRVRELAKDVGFQIRREAAEVLDKDQAKRMFAWGTESLSSGRIGAMVNLARGLDGILLDHERLDTQPYLLGVRNGVVDLRTGELRPADPADLMTMQAPVEYDPHARAARWERAMLEWFPDPEVRAYVKRLTGAALIGAQRDHVFVIHYGTGGNGKGTFIRALEHVLGPYAMVLHLSLIEMTRRDEHDTVKADLFRVRLAIASETERRIELREASVKNLTGGDRIRARRMREDPWSFEPTHSLWLQTNYLPRIRGRDEGIWRRVRVVKWVASFGNRSGPKEDLDATFRAEAAGILRWAVEGCLDYQREGLAEPEAVIRDTLEYRRAEDAFGRFAADVGLVFDRSARTLTDDLIRAFREWASSEGLTVNNNTIGDLKQWLQERGAREGRETVRGPDGKRRQPRFWRGVKLGEDLQAEGAV